jgi:Asp-tRNA(Asn)/Glu-tRNA(Gln) amidotransferase A subunit family amidase
VAALHDRSAVELLALYASGEASPVDVMRDLLAHIERCEPHIAATWALDADAALQAAHESEDRWQRGQARALDGVPVTIKENIATRGTPTPLGTAATVLTPAAADAPPAARLREAGAVIVCKTTMPDYGMLSSSLSSFHKLTRNPWDLSKSPGGSSAGAGAACAAGYGPIHLGTDIGGSIRLPASWCGVLGFKPSLGRIPIDPPYAGRVAGPLTRTVEDAALAMSVLSRPDARDAMSLPWQDIAWRDLAIELRGLKLGLWLDAGWGTALTPEVRAAVEAAASAFEQAGAIVELVPPFTTRTMADGMDHFWRMRSWLDISALPVERQARVLPFIRQWVARGETLSAAQVFRGYSQMGALRDAAVNATKRFDFVLSPVSPAVAFAAEWAMPSNDPEHPFEHIAFTLPFNMSEQPAVSVNAGHGASGLPIGVQLIGHRHDDLGVLRLARAWEQLRGPQRPWPNLREPQAAQGRSQAA